MALIETTSIAAPTKAGPAATPLAGIKTFLARFFVTAFRPYRPELHYMRGPGPAWRAKHGLDVPVRLKPRDL